MLILRNTLSEQKPQTNQVEHPYKILFLVIYLLALGPQSPIRQFQAQNMLLRKNKANYFHILNFKAIFYLLDGLFKVHHRTH